MPAIQEFVARIEMAPEKVIGREVSRIAAVRDLVLRIWQRKLRKERNGLGEGDEERRSEITYDLNRLKSWEDGSAIIKIELSD